MSRSQADFIKQLRPAVDRLFDHRKNLRRVTVRFALVPEGLWFSANITARTNEEMAAARSRIIAWEDLETLDPAELVAIVDWVVAGCREALAGSVS